MKAYYGGRKPADWARPAEVTPITLCKLTGQPAPVDAAPEFTIQDLALRPDPALPAAPCGTPATGGTPSGGGGGGAGLPPFLPPPPRAGLAPHVSHPGGPLPGGRKRPFSGCGSPGPPKGGRGGRG